MPCRKRARNRPTFRFARSSRTSGWLRYRTHASIYSSESVIPASLEFVDIAGLVKGASQGEGLGNQFLSHIRQVHAVAHVVRCFVDENVVHVDGSVDPVRDVEVIDTELLLADLVTVE